MRRVPRLKDAGDCESVTEGSEQRKERVIRYSGFETGSGCLARNGPWPWMQKEEEGE